MINSSIKGLDEIEFQKRSPKDKQLMAGRKLQNLRDEVEDAERHVEDNDGKLDGAETKEQRLEKQLEECRKKKTVFAWRASRVENLMA